MNGQVDNAEYEFLWKLLANPADPNHSYIFNLQSLVTDFPQSGMLRALLMPNGDKRHIKHAAAYFNPRTLHKLATAPDSLAKVSADQIVFSDAPEELVAENYFSIPEAEPFVPPVLDEPESEYTPVVDDSAEEVVAEEIAQAEIPAPEIVYNTFAEPEPIVDPSREQTPVYIDEEEEHTQTENNYTEEIPAYIEEEVNSFSHPALTETTGTPIDEEPIHEEIAEAPIIEQVEETQPEVSNWEPAVQVVEDFVEPVNEQDSLAKQYDAYLAESEAAPTHPVSSYDEGDRYFHQPIEDEVYDEIVSIEDIGLEQLAILNKSAGNGDDNYFVFEPAEIAEADKAPVAEAQPTVETPAIEEPVEQTAPAAEAQPVAESVALHPAVIADEPATQNKYTFADEKSNVSMYNDEKLPYSFLWWLNKTRKEHEDIYQPYAGQSAQQQATPPQAEAPQQKEPLDELQKQYYQNIVSTSSITDLDKNLPKIQAANRKEDKIIERFIHEEPQIKHPTDVKLDNENKAKRSSEDKEELVTETLARIYTEQMLYHKALLTYKKLMLKYPEKSLYFAGQIEQLENKIN